jgi:hypothetical protein
MDARRVVDSIDSQLISTQRLLISLMPDLAAMSPARCGGITLSTSALNLSNSRMAVLVPTSTSFTSLLGGIR